MTHVRICSSSSSVYICMYYVCVYVCMYVLKGHLLTLDIATKTNGAQNMDLEGMGSQSPKISECFQHRNRLYTPPLLKHIYKRPNCWRDWHMLYKTYQGWTTLPCVNGRPSSNYVCVRLFIYLVLLILLSKENTSSLVLYIIRMISVYPIYYKLKLKMVAICVPDLKFISFCWTVGAWGCN